MLIAGWVTWQRSAARPKCRVSVSAAKYRSCLKVGIVHQAH
jgi:hypothetical protein